MEVGPCRDINRLSALSWSAMVGKPTFLKLCMFMFSFVYNNEKVEQCWWNVLMSSFQIEFQSISIENII